MEANDPQVMYMVLILPSLFGLTLIGEGMYKLTQSRSMGWFNILMGFGFLAAVIGGFLVLSGAM